MVCAHQIVGKSLVRGELVQTRRETLGLTTRIAEDDRAAVREDLLENLRIETGPDAGAARRQRSSRRATDEFGFGVATAEVTHVLDRHAHLELELFAHTCIDDRDGTRLAGGEPSEKAGRLFERSLRRRQSDALRFAAGDLAQSFDAEHEMCTALRARQCMDFVDDDGVDVDQRLARL